MSHKSSLVSVVIPTFNRSHLIERAIRSVLSQSYYELQVIVADDASIDDTRERVAALKQGDHRIEYVRHDANRGPQAARNTGIEASEGKYVAFLDSDNEWLPPKIELQVKRFSEGSDQLGVVYCGIQNAAGDNAFFREHMPRHRGYIYPMALRDWIADTSTLVVRRDYLDRAGGFDEGIRAYQEWDLCIRLALEAEFDYVEQVLAIYHEQEGNAISKNLLQNALGYLDVTNSHYQEIFYEVGPRVLSDHMYKAGRIFMEAGALERARVCFRQSMRLYPGNVRTALHLLISSMGLRMYAAVLSFVQKLKIPRGRRG